MPDDLLPDALELALSNVIADARREWIREVAGIASETRAILAELRAQNADLRRENDDLRRVVKDMVDTEIVRLKEVATSFKDGAAGAPGEPGAKGEPGDPPDYGVILERSEPLIKSLIATRWDEFTNGLPLPERGEPGPAGRDADPQVVEAMVTAHVTRAVAEIPAPKDGKDGENGQDGLPGPEGKQGESGPIGQQAEAGPQGEVGPQGEAGEAGPQGLIGPQGAPGLDADDEAIIKRVLETMPVPQDGAPGRDGQDADQEAIVKRVLEILPVVKDGAPGRDGVNLAGCLIDRDNHLVVTLSDGTARDLGEVVGKDGAPGIGRDGADGKDGLSFDDFDLEPEYDGERTVRLRWRNGTKEHIREWRLPIVIDRGVYRAGAAYQTGDAVSFGGSIWIAQKDTSDKPGEGQTGWRLSVKSGRPGKDGAPGEKGEQGPQGRPGIDWTAR